MGAACRSHPNNKEIKVLKKLKSLKSVVSYLFAFTCITVHLHAFTTFISPDPTIIDTTGGAFEIYINVDDQATEFRGFKLIFTYNDSIMDFISTEKGALMAGQPIGWWNVVEESSHSVRVECIIFGAGLYVNGPGTILVLTFNGLSECITELQYAYTEFYDILGSIIPDTSADDGTVIIGSASLSIPQNASISLDEDSLYVKWDSVIGANGYKIFSSQNPYSGFENIGTTPDTTFAIPDPAETKMFIYITGDTNLFGNE